VSPILDHAETDVTKLVMKAKEIALCLQKAGGSRRKGRVCVVVFAVILFLDVSTVGLVGILTDHVCVVHMNVKWSRLGVSWKIFDVCTKASITLDAGFGFMHWQMVFWVIREMDDFVIINNDHAIQASHEAVVRLGGVLSDELLRRKELDGQARNMYGMNLHGYWSAVSVGKSPIDIADSGNCEAASDAM